MVHHCGFRAARGTRGDARHPETLTVMPRALLAGLFAGALAFAALPTPADAAGKPATLRGELVHRIVMKWGPQVQREYGVPVREWAMDMVPVFGRVSLGSLAAAAQAPSFDAMNTALLRDGRGVSASGNQLAAINAGALQRPTKALGDVASDLVFVPVTPCRIIDTRVVGGPIPADGTRNFDITEVTDFSFQGGAANNCNIGAAGSFAAAVINFTVVTPSIAGFVTAYPFGATRPLAATVNYVAGDIRGNLAVVRLDQGDDAEELSVYSFAQTHLVADIVGYYIEPQATALDCIEQVSTEVTVAANGFTTATSASCPTGYSVTGGGCSMSDFGGRVVTTRSFPIAGNHFCAFANQSAGALLGTAYVNCCRTPGRN
jgi:hypothetical protein